MDRDGAAGNTLRGLLDAKSLAPRPRHPLNHQIARAFRLPGACSIVVGLPGTIACIFGVRLKTWEEVNKLGQTCAGGSGPWPEMQKEGGMDFVTKETWLHNMMTWRGRSRGYGTRRSGTTVGNQSVQL